MWIVKSWGFKPRFFLFFYEAHLQWAWRCVQPQIKYIGGIIMNNPFYHYSWTDTKIENWILRTIDSIESAEDPRVPELYQAAKALGKSCAEITDVIITFEELLKEKGVDVGKHICMPGFFARTYYT